MPLPGMLQKRSLNDLEVNMPSLLDAAEAFSKLGKKSVEIDQAACVRVRHRHASCMACFQVCAHEAIARDDDGLLAIDNHLCTGCGACASVCPTSALQLVEDVPELVRAAIESIAEQADALQDDTDPSSADSLRTEKPCGTLTISCEYLRNQEAALEERAHSEAGLRVKASPDEIDPPKAKTEHEAECSLTLSCLAALDEAALISAACSNVEVRYESGDCACCPNAQGELIATLGEQATRFLGAFLAAATPERPLPAARALPAAWSLVTPNDAESATTNTSPELSRRGLFDHFIERTTDSIAEAAVGTFYVSTTAQDQKRTLAQRLFADKGILKHIEAVLLGILQNLLDGGAHEQRHGLVCLGNAFFLHAPLQFASSALTSEALSAHAGKILRVGLVKALCNHGVFLLSILACDRLLCAAPPHGGNHTIGAGSAAPVRCRSAAAGLLPNQRFSSSSSSSSFLPPRTISPDGT